MNTAAPLADLALQREAFDQLRQSPRLAIVRRQMILQFLGIARTIITVITALCLLMLLFPESPRLTIMVSLIFVMLEGLLVFTVRRSAQHNATDAALRRLLLYSLPLIFFISIVLQIPHFFMAVAAIIIIMTILVEQWGFVYVITALSFLLYGAGWLISPVLTAYMATFEYMSPELVLSLNFIFTTGAMIALIACVYLIGHQLQQVVDDVQLMAQSSDKLRLAQQETNQQLSMQLEQQEQLLTMVQTLEVPTIPLKEGMIVVPLISYLDTRRMESIEQRVLHAIEMYQSHTVILEMTGVPTVDSFAASRLMQLARAIRLLGARPVLTGLHANIALVLSSMDINLKELEVFASIEDVLIQEA